MDNPGILKREFLVNTVTNGAQISPVIAALANGRFAIAYLDFSASTDYGFTDTSNTAIRVELFDADGSHAGAPIQVNTVTTYYQQSPRIAALADGGFAVTYSDLSIGWDSMDDDIWAEAVRMQRFSGDGVKLGLETLVNTTVYGDQDYPSVAGLDNGQFVIAWDDGYSDEDENIFAQVFNPDGSRSGGEFRINDETELSQTGSDIAGLDNGRYVVTWTDSDGSDGSGGNGADGDGGGVFARLFDDDGSAITSDFAVNTTTASHQYEAKVTGLGAGRFVVVWHDFSRGVETGYDDASSYAVRGQIFDATGARIGAEFLVNQTTLWGQYQPAVEALSDGRFVVAWCDTSSGLETGGDDSSFGAVRARIFLADGSPSSDEFLLASTTEGHQCEPQIAELPDGRVVFTWTDYSHGVETGGDDTDNAAIRARILDLRTEAATWQGSDAADNFVGTIWADRLSGDTGDDVLHGDRGDDILFGDGGQDCLFGGTGNDLLRGKSGGDRLRGQNGDDVLGGGGGADVLLGNKGQDLLAGGIHDDRLEGGADADVLTGGTGCDTFVIAQARHSGPGPAGRDRITDFTPGQDLIDLGAIDADPSTPGDDAFVFLRRSPFTHTPGELIYSRGAAHAMLAADLDGDGAADMQVLLDGYLMLHDVDFTL